MSDTTRPVPVPDERSREFWAAAAAHTLVMARCSTCNQFSHPPDDVCPHCGSADARFEFVPLDGSGRVRSWTLVRQSFLPGFDVPFVLVDVELSAQADLRLIGRLVDGPGVQLQLDLPVRLVFEDLVPGVAIPASRSRPIVSGRMASSNRVAIVGYAQSEVQRHAQSSLGALTAETAEQPIADAGLRSRTSTVS